jgi:hypothetical protein
MFAYFSESTILIYLINFDYDNEGSHARGVDEVLDDLHELFLGDLVIAVLVVDGERLIHLLLRYGLVYLMESLLQSSSAQSHSGSQSYHHRRNRTHLQKERTCSW